MAHLFELLDTRGRGRLFFPVSLLIHGVVVFGLLALTAFSPESLPLTTTLRVPVGVIGRVHADPAPHPAVKPRPGGGGGRPRLAPPPSFVPPVMDVHDEPSLGDVLDAYPVCPECGVGPLVGEEPPGGGNGPGASDPGPPRVVRVGEVRPPRKLRDQKPVYPPLALAAGVEGTVVIECTIGVDGRISALKVLKSVPLLDAAAEEAVQRWVYTPTLLDGVPVSVIMNVTVTFIRR